MMDAKKPTTLRQAVAAVEEAEHPKVGNLQDVVQAMNVSDGDEAALDAGGDPPEDEAAPEEDTSDIPEWVVLPDGFKMPLGRRVTFVKIYAAMTDTPAKGDRQCILWNLTEADEKLAIKRTRGEGIRVMDEFTKQMIRAIDGKTVDWTGNAGPRSPNTFWNDIGGKYRQQLKNVYAKNHSMDTAEMVDFFSNCFAVRTVSG